MTMRNENLGHPPNRIGGLLDVFCGLLAKERPLNLLLVCSLVAACIFCLCLFDIGFLLGTSAYWKNPRGIVGNSWADISTALSGYFYFQRDTWQFPIFHIGKLGAPVGTNVIFTDSPLLALLGRMAFWITGMPVNLYGLWTAFCFIASAMAFTALVAALGQRNLAAAAMATVTGLCMPALMARWGHMCLMAQFEISLALIFYLRNQRCGNAWLLFAQGAALTWLALWTHPYLFAMVSPIVLATIAQSVSNRTLRGTSATLLLSALVAVLGAIIVLSGHLQSSSELGANGVGIYSMNLLSPFLPQHSGLFTPFRNMLIDATGGQYEGFSYLGAGILLLLLMTLPRQLTTLRAGFSRHTWLSVLFVGFTIFALSNIIYFGSIKLLHLPLPERALQLASMFRSTGRFFWPVMYALAALAIAAPIPFYGRYGVLLLCLAMPLQWIDSSPLRQAMAASTRAPEKPHLDLTAWGAAIRRHRSVQVLPQYSCLAHSRGWNSDVTIQLQLLAAFAGRPINSVYAARHTANCRADEHIDGTPRVGARQLSVFLDEFPGFSRLRSLAATRKECLAGNGLVVCSDIPGAASTLTQLVWTDRK